MHLGRNNPHYCYTMKLDGQDAQLKTCSDEKDLGVTFDNEMKFDKHIGNSVNKANKMLGLIKRSFTDIDNETFLKLYKAMVRPHLEYGNIIWHPMLKRQSITIEKVQRRATKLVKGFKDLTYQERLAKLNLHTLYGRRIRGDLIETYKIFNGFTDLKWNKFFDTPIYTSTRHSTGKIFIKHSHTKLRRCCYSVRVANLWNNLPIELKNAKNTNTFKNLLDELPNFKMLCRHFD